MNTPNGPITAALQPFVDRHELAGAVTLVASREQTLSLDAVGFADVAAQAPMRPDTLFWIASMTKPMTATALMMLVDEGTVDVNAPVEEYLPEFQGQMVVAERAEDRVLLRKPSHPITVAEVLCHTSGLPFSSPLEEPTLDALPLRDAVRSYALLPLLFEPGTQYGYSNAGTNTAARILEAVSGVPYAQFIQARLFDPLGMTDTTFVPTDAQAQRIAKSYKPDAAGAGLEETPISQLHYPLTDPRRQPMPAGGLFSTAPDVARFCRMILNGGALDGRRCVSESAVARMTRKQTGDAVGEGYGFGWAVGDGGFGHGGALSTNLSIDPERGLVLVYLVQHAGFPGEGVKSLDAFQSAARAEFGNSIQ